MPVFLTTLLAPNGNRVSRPIVAADAHEAAGIMSVEHGLHAIWPDGLKVEATLMADPDGEIEASLSRMNARNEERELWTR
jgi:hypothetical protein